MRHFTPHLRRLSMPKVTVEVTKCLKREDDDDDDDDVNVKGGMTKVFDTISGSKVLGPD